MADGLCRRCGKRVPLTEVENEEWTASVLKDHDDPDGNQCRGSGRLPANEIEHAKLATEVAE